MHPNPIFRQTTDGQNLDFAREQGFGLLCVANADVAPLVSHIPFVLSDDENFLDFHLVRSNPIAGLIAKTPTNARLAIQGPHSYISPDWYNIEDQVPTWNYIAVHLTGQIGVLPEECLRDLLERQSALFEAKLQPKAPWTTDKMQEDVLFRMMRQIIPCRMKIDDVQGTWKLGQNKAPAVRASAADHVEGFGIGQETTLISGLMRATLTKN